MNEVKRFIIPTFQLYNLTTDYLQLGTYYSLLTAYCLLLTYQVVEKMNMIIDGRKKK